MGIFTRFRDIVSANINSMLDKAEDPEKMIKLMIHEMEDTLIELKTSCASVIAGQKKLSRKLEAVQEKVNLWTERAELAVNKGRDDLAREALIEKRRYSETADEISLELDGQASLQEQYQEDINELEDKLKTAKEKKMFLLQRHKRASNKKRAHEDIRKSDSADTMARFEKLESRIEEMEAEADLVRQPKKTRVDEFDDLATDDEIEAQLAKLKASNNSSEEK